MTTVIFKAGETAPITGYELDCECSHCGRVLKMGVKLEQFSGAFGVDCLTKCFGVSTQYGYKVRPNRDGIKTRAIVARKGADYAKSTYGWTLGGPVFQYPVAKEIVSQ